MMGNILVAFPFAEQLKVRTCAPDFSSSQWLAPCSCPVRFSGAPFRTRAAMALHVPMYRVRNIMASDTFGFSWYGAFLGSGRYFEKVFYGVSQQASDFECLLRIACQASNHSPLIHSNK